MVARQHIYIAHSQKLTEDGKTAGLVKLMDEKRKGISNSIAKPLQYVDSISKPSDQKSLAFQM